MLMTHPKPADTPSPSLSLHADNGTHTRTHAGGTRGDVPLRATKIRYIVETQLKNGEWVVCNERDHRGRFIANFPHRLRERKPCKIVKLAYI